MEAKESEMQSMKQRLDELHELLDTGYLSENEYQIARVNLLKENGIDVAIHSRGEARRGREPRKGGGCGCFLFLLLLIAVGAGVALAVPEWADRMGGVCTAVQEQVVKLWTEIFPGKDEPVAPVPDPVPSRDLPSRATPALPASPPAIVPNPAASGDVTSADESKPAATPEAKPVAEKPASPDVSREPAAPQTSVPQPARAASPDAAGPALPKSAEEPPVTIIEIPSSTSAAIPSVPEHLTARGESAEQTGPTEQAEQAPSLDAPRGFVSARSVRIRSTPDTSTNDNVVGWGRNGDRFTVLEEGVGKDGSRWYRIRYDEGNKEGWISGTLVTLESR